MTASTLVERLQRAATDTGATLTAKDCEDVMRLARAAMDVVLEPESRARREELAAALVGLGAADGVRP